MAAAWMIRPLSRFPTGVVIARSSARARARRLDFAEATHTSDAQTGASLLDGQLHASPVIVFPTLETRAATEEERRGLAALVSRHRLTNYEHIFLEIRHCSIGTIGVLRRAAA